ncbi:MAG: hypothetical protein ACI4MS_05675 [Candidatus Coproplasma sp.]
MKWTKRLKWIKLSKIIIPIALAISLVFAGFAVFATEAENFVVKIGDGGDVSLALSYNEDLSDMTDHLDVPVNGYFRDVTWDPINPGDVGYEDSLYDPEKFVKNLPDDIAQHEGVHPVRVLGDLYSFFSFSFYLTNISTKTVATSMSINIDQMIVSKNKYNYHLDDALRVMLIEGKPLLSEKSGYYLYKKREASTKNESELLSKIAYSDYVATPFESSSCIMSWNYDNGREMILQPNESRRFTIVMWLEGWDNECVDEILPEFLKMSMTFNAQ